MQEHEQVEFASQIFIQNIVPQCKCKDHHAVTVCLQQPYGCFNALQTSETSTIPRGTLISRVDELITRALASKLRTGHL